VAAGPRETSPQRTGRFVRAAAEEFQLLVEGVKDYAIFLLDRDGHVMTWNLGAERIKRYAAAEILGQHFSRFYEPEDQAGGRPAMALATAARDGRFEGYGWRVRQDGSRFYAHVTITPLYGESGDLHGFAKVTQDVTAQREAERKLREREQQLAEAHAIAQLGSFELSQSADGITWSPELCRIFGLEPRTFTSSLDAFVAYFHPDDQRLGERVLRQAATAGTSFQLEQRIVRPNGQIRVLLSRGRCVGYEPGLPQRVIGICQDVTEQREGERQLAEAHAQADLSRRLQSGLLPVLSLRDPTLALRTRYLPGQERALLGADFFDALELSDGTVATIVGDVAGHGPAEAAVGVALRATWRALVLAGHGPKEVLDGLDTVLVSDRPSEEMFATVCCLWVHPDRRSVAIALAGHPPPLLARGRKVEVVEVLAGPALGILEQGYPWEIDTLEVGEVWALLCYTDGLIEGMRTPDSVERFGIESLSDAAAKLLDEQASADGLLDGLLDVVLEANGQDLSDDTAMLCLTTYEQPGLASAPKAMTGQRSPDPGAPDAVERLDLSPDASSATRARRFIRQVATTHALESEVVDQLVLVGTELVTNAVLHARTALALTLELYPDQVRISVTDRSSAPATLRRYHPEALTGRGLALVGAVSQRWGVDPAGVGKRVWAEIERPTAGPGNGHQEAPGVTAGG
jgi:PAS domain S-box-containing protein